MIEEMVPEGSKDGNHVDADWDDKEKIIPRHCKTEEHKISPWTEKTQRVNEQSNDTYGNEDMLDHDIKQTMTDLMQMIGKVIWYDQNWDERNFLSMRSHLQYEERVACTIGSESTN